MTNCPCDVCAICRRARISVSESFGIPITRRHDLSGLLVTRSFDDSFAEMVCDAAASFGNGELAAWELELDAEAFLDTQRAEPVAEVTAAAEGGVAP